MTDTERTSTPDYRRNLAGPAPTTQEALAWRQQVIQDTIGTELPGGPREAHPIVDARQLSLVGLRRHQPATRKQRAWTNNDPA